MPSAFIIQFVMHMYGQNFIDSKKCLKYANYMYYNDVPLL